MSTKKPIIVKTILGVHFFCAVVSLLAAALSFFILLKRYSRFVGWLMPYFSGPYYSSEFPFVLSLLGLGLQVVLAVRQMILGIDTYRKNLTNYQEARRVLLWLWPLTVLNPLLPELFVFFLPGIWALLVFWHYHPALKKAVEAGFVRKEEYREGRLRGLSELRVVEASSPGVVILSVLLLLIALDLFRVGLWAIPFAGKFLYILTRFEFYMVLYFSKIGVLILAVVSWWVALLTLRFSMLGRIFMMMLGWLAVAAATLNIFLVDYSTYDKLANYFYVGSGVFFVVFSYSLIILLRDPAVRKQFKGDVPGFLTDQRKRRLSFVTAGLILAMIFGLSLKSGEKSGVELFKNVIYLVRRHSRDKIMERWQEVNEEFYRLAGEKKYARAEEIGGQLLRLSESLWGPSHPRVASIANDIAVIYYTQKKYGEARPLFARALDIHEYLLGHDDPMVATDLNNLASIYRAQGNYDRAQSMFSRAIEIYTEAFGAEHYYTRMTKENLLRTQEEENIRFSSR